MIETAIKEDLFLDKKLIIPKNKLDAIRIMNELHPVVGGQPTHEKDQPNDNNPILDLACTLANIHASGVGEHADLRSIQNEPPRFFYGEGFISGISSLKGNGILAIFGHWLDGSGNYAVKQFYYADKEISYRNALSEDKWGDWIDVLTSNSQLDYNKLLNVPITSTLSDDKNKIASIFSVNEINRKANTAQITANNADLKAINAQKTADTGVADAKSADEKATNAQTTANTGVTNAKIAQDRADAAFTRVKPITEGGTGATNVANARKNLGIEDIPVDQVFLFDSNIVPSGYIEYAGQSINRDLYPRLGARFGSNMPNRRDRYPRFANGSLGGVGGGTQEDALQNHTHSFFYANQSASGSGSGDVPRGSGTQTNRISNVVGARVSSETRVKGVFLLACAKAQ